MASVLFLSGLSNLNTEQVLEIMNAVGQVLSEDNLLLTLSKNILELFMYESVGTFPLIKLWLERRLGDYFLKSHFC